MKCKNCGHWLHSKFGIHQSRENTDGIYGIECWCGCTNPEPKEAEKK